MLGEKLARVTVSHYMLSYMQVQCDLPLWQLHSDFGDFGTGVCYVTNIAMAESNLDTELSAQQASSTDVVATQSARCP